MRVINCLLVGCVVMFAYVIYELKYETRALDRRAGELRQSIRSERDAVAVLRAEWSHLNRPERIEKLARKHLGLAPLKASQFMTARQYAALRLPSAAEVAARLLGQPPPDQRRRQAALR
jgi:cell division protein FtsL